MGSDDDLARLLPQPPPPRPSRREAAIAAAMERFDETSLAAAPPSRTPPRRRGWWRLPSAQTGAFASVLLIAAISVTLALHIPDGGLAPSSDQPAGVPPLVPGTAPAEPGAGARPKALASAEPMVPAPTPLVRAPSSRSAVAMVDRGAADAARNEAAPPPAMMAPPPGAVPLPPPPAALSAGSAALVAAEPAAPYARVAKGAAPRVEIAEQGEGASVNDIVVTGSLISRGPRTSQRGDWNACTLDDPRRDLRKCKSSIGRATNKAAVSLAEGLKFGWQGDWAAAVEAFTKAIAAKPRSGFAYLNRGLAYRHSGDLDRAAADLDLAVRYDGDARSYYTRALLKRERGDDRGAQIDAARAMKLDPDYGDVSN